MRRINIGCSGWNYADWRDGVFYPRGLPARDWLRFYAERFTTVELNTTFYRLPRREVVEHWVAETPADFTFAVKVSRFLTHVKRLRDTRTHLALLLERIEPLVTSGKLGPLLWQLPPTFQRDDERLARSLADTPSGLRHAIEFRHESWLADGVLELLREHSAALVLADRPGSRPLRDDELTADFVYIRLHQGTRGRRGNYSRTELEDWADRIRRWASPREVFAYFNNDWEGFAPSNASALAAML